MENLFRPGKFFVIFCALIIIVVGGTHLFANYVVAEKAKLDGVDVFTWEWPGMLKSSAEITQADVIKKSDHDAIVRVKGTQTLTSAGGKSETVDCNAVLTLYRSTNPASTGKWELGKVELQ